MSWLENIRKRKSEEPYIIYSKDLSNFEARMRKKARMDQEARLERERVAAAAKQPRMSSNMIPLGGDMYADVTSIKGHTRVHLQKYIPDDQGCYKEMGKGVAIPPAVWDLLEREFSIIRGDEFMNKTVIIKRSLCISSRYENGEQLIAFQRLVEREDFQLEFKPVHVVLNRTQFSNLLFNFEKITNNLKQVFFSDTLSYFVDVEIEKSQINFDQLDFPCMSGLWKSLCVCVTREMSSIISELYEIDSKGLTPYKKNSSYDDYDQYTDREFLMMSYEEKYLQYSESALFRIDWSKIAKQFVEMNKTTHLVDALGREEFLDGIKINRFFKEVEKMYLEE